MLEKNGLTGSTAQKLTKDGILIADLEVEAFKKQ